MESFGYGTTMIRLKPGVRRRSSITIGDSLNNNSDFIMSPALPIDDVGKEVAFGIKKMAEWGVTDRRRYFLERRKESKDYRDLLAAADDAGRYIETQIFGKLGLEDVDRIMIKSKSKARQLRQQLDDMGYTDIEVVTY